MIPELEPHCGSWIITRKDDGEVIGEFYDRKNAEALFDTGKVVIETAAQYLGRINREIQKKAGIDS